MWIIPNKLSAFAPAMEASSLDLNERASMLSQSLMWRSKPGRLQTWLTRLKREEWLQHLSTRILKPSLTQDFEARWTASLADTHVSLSQQREGDREQMIRDISGHISQTGFDFADQDGASLKMSKDTLRLDSPRWSAIWKNWVTEQRGAYSQRVKLAHRTKGNGSSSWPTITVNESKNSEGKSQWNRNSPPLGTFVHGQLNRANPSTNGKSQGSANNWPTPRANKVHPEISENNRHQLANRGKSNLEEDIAGHCGNATGKLNPDWVCQLMGVPVGWVNPEGVRNRTDELRMLGNGVVPQTAAKAFVTLSERLND